MPMVVGLGEFDPLMLGSDLTDRYEFLDIVYIQLMVYLCCHLLPGLSYPLKHRIYYLRD